MPLIGFAMSNFLLSKDPNQTVQFAIDHQFNHMEIWADVPLYYQDALSINARREV